MRALVEISQHIGEEISMPPPETIGHDPVAWDHISGLANALARAKAALAEPAPKSAPEEAPSEAVLTAPERIWLQIGDDLDLPFPDNHEDITWCSGPGQESDVEYVRADLARSLYVAWRTIEDAPYSIPILCVWDNGTQMVAFQDVMEGWQDAETRDPLETKPTHWMHLPTAPEAK